MSDLIYSVNNLLCNKEGFLKTNGASYFNIPEYQRGYKWKSESVKQLLDDVHNFLPGGDKFYCLQNITIVKKTDGKDQYCFNVVDGQQRLTTLVILLSYLGKFDNTSGKLIYSVREKTHNFLKDFIIGQKIWKESAFKEFEGLIKIEGNEKYNHQDIFYIFQAAKTIESWFKEKDKVAFSEKLLNHVKLIVNSVNNSHEEKIFGNLNSKRVPLDGSDLIRAILITRAAREECDGTDIKDIVRINERRVRIGWELDEINRWWNKENVKGYFNSFKSINCDSNTQPSFNLDNGINILYALYSEIKDKDNLNFSTFENGQNGNDDKSDDHLEMYHEILDLHKTLQDWYTDRELYHLLGYYFITLSTKEFKAVYDLWKMASKDRNGFIKEIKTKIKLKAFGGNIEGVESGLNSTLKDIKDTKSYWYNNDSHKVLILLDIIDLSKVDKYNPLPFLKYEFFNVNSEDKEHIFPQTPLETDFKYENMKKYLDLIKSLKLEEEFPAEITNLNNNLSKDSSEQSLNEVRDKINSYLSDKIHINSIGNIVLLDYKVNRSYGNDYYTDKRRRIVEESRDGQYIRQHTLNTFVKAGNSDLNIWNQRDIENNANEIANKIEKFFMEGK